MDHFLVDFLANGGRGGGIPLGAPFGAPLGAPLGAPFGLLGAQAMIITYQYYDFWPLWLKCLALSAN